jgi:hypothetical protein
MLLRERKNGAGAWRKKTRQLAANPGWRPLRIREQGTWETIHPTADGNSQSSGSWRIQIRPLGRPALPGVNVSEPQTDMGFVGGLANCSSWMEVSARETGTDT